MAIAELAQAVRINREEANKLAIDVGRSKLKSILGKAQEKLNKKLQAINDSTSFTAAQTELTMKQIQDLLVEINPQMKALLQSQGAAAAESSMTNLLDYMQQAEKHFTGIAMPLPINEAAMLDQVRNGVDSSILNRISSNPDDPAGYGILQRYGVETVRLFEEKIQMGILTRAPWNEIRQDLIDSSPFLQGSPMFWAERIVRTETMSAYNRAGYETIMEAEEQLGDMCRILSATFDDRTGWDSYQVHGQIRRPNEPFQWGEGSYMHPPNRPNDREVIVPHRIAWPIPAYLKWRDDGEVLARYQKQRKSGSPGPRPLMSTIPITEFGKVQAKPQAATEPKQDQATQAVQEQQPAPVEQAKPKLPMFDKDGKEIDYSKPAPMPELPPIPPPILIPESLPAKITETPPVKLPMFDKDGNEIDYKKLAKAAAEKEPAAIPPPVAEKPESSKAVEEIAKKLEEEPAPKTRKKKAPAEVVEALPTGDDPWKDMRFNPGQFSTIKPQNGNRVDLDSLPELSLVHEKIIAPQKQLPRGDTQWGESKEDYQARAREAVSKLSPSTAEALEAFTGNSYGMIRRAETSGDTKSGAGKLASNLANVFNEATAIEPTTVFRGMSLGGESKKAFLEHAATAETWGLGIAGKGATSSTTRDITVVQQFGCKLSGEMDSGEIGVLYKLRAKSGVPIETISSVGDFEREILMSKQARFATTGMHWLAGSNKTVLVIEGDEL